MEDKEKEFIKNVNIDKAKNKTFISIVLITISILTYVMPFMYGEVDFGIIFEIASLTCLLFSRYYMTKYDEIRSKRYIICSIVAIGWILIYDIIYLLSTMRTIEDLFAVAYIFLYGQIFSVAYISLLFAINRNLAKADNPIKYIENTDWFY